MSDIRRVVIVGAGQAGGEAASHLRANGFSGEITLIGEEKLPPYQRPPLSKKFLAGEWDEDRLPLRPADIYATENITLLLNRQAVWIDRAQKRVRLDGAQELVYDALILATGARPRRINAPGVDLPGVHYLRTFTDVEEMKPRLKPGAKLVVIGAGFIGLEVAAVAREMGLDVTVLEALARPMARATSPEMAGFFMDQHIAKGVKFVLGVQAAVMKGESEVRAVGLSDGDDLPADLVVIGAGIIPEVSLAEKAGLRIDNGIVTDSATRTADPAIFAIGDCASRPCRFYGGRMVRGESVHNAIEGAKIAAATIAGVTPPPEELPWNWSDQYDLKLTIGGISSGYDAIVTRGNPADRRFSLFYYRGGQLLGVDAVNQPADHLATKMALQKGVSLPADQVGDTSVAMKDIMNAAVRSAS